MKQNGPFASQWGLRRGNQQVTQIRENGSFLGKFLFVDSMRLCMLKSRKLVFSYGFACFDFRTVPTAGWEFAAVALSVRKRVGYSRTACR